MSFPVISLQVVASIRTLIERAKTGESDPDLKEATLRTGALPVYADMTGALLITSAAEVVRYEFETGRINLVTAGPWRELALARAARKFPELDSLRPSRPNSSVTCPQCGGTGVTVGNVDCGMCYGLGWKLGLPEG